MCVVIEMKVGLEPGEWDARNNRLKSPRVGKVIQMDAHRSRWNTKLYCGGQPDEIARLVFGCTLCENPLHQ